MSLVALEGYILVPEDELETVKLVLDTHINLTRNEPGCLVFEVTQNAHQALRFDVYEEFSDKQAFELHQNRVKNSEWGRVTANVTRHYTIKGA